MLMFIASHRLIVLSCYSIKKQKELILDKIKYITTILNASNF